MPDSKATNAASYTTRWDTIKFDKVSICHLAYKPDRHAESLARQFQTE
jgi:hypothetical protein